MSEALRPYGPGKFDTMLDAAIYSESLNGCDAECGDVDRGGWYGAFFGTVLSCDSEQWESLTMDERTYIAEKRGAILTADSQGFVRVVYYDTEAEAIAAWERIEADEEGDEE